MLGVDVCILPTMQVTVILDKMGQGQLDIEIGRQLSIAGIEKRKISDLVRVESSFQFTKNNNH